MLSEFLKTSDSGINSSWQYAMPGVSICRFQLNPAENKFPIDIPLKLESMHFEALFCQGGALMLRPQDSLVSVEGRDILLLSDCSEFRSVQIASALSGILVSVDGNNASQSLDALTKLLGRMRLSTGDLKRKMDRHHGYARFAATAWTQSVFSALEVMGTEDQGMYSALKTLELLFLFCADSPLLTAENENPVFGGYLSRTVTDMRVYMESHLDEKLTIEAMSRSFNISPTAFKSCFRSLYGQPVHRWLQNQRMRRASELLRNTPLGVLQVAQAVGYEGLSQFNLVFKRKFGVTPSQYKKMSDPV